jgi:hypothetical protein
MINFNDYDNISEDDLAFWRDTVLTLLKTGLPVQTALQGADNIFTAYVKRLDESDGRA